MLHRIKKKHGEGVLTIAGVWVPPADDTKHCSAAWGLAQQAGLSVSRVSRLIAAQESLAASVEKYGKWET